VAQAPFPPATVSRAPEPKETIPPLPERAPRKQETQPAAAPAVGAKPNVKPAPATAPTAPAAVAAAAPAMVESKTPAPTVSILTPTLINGSGAAPAATTQTPAAPEFKTEVKVASETAPAAETTAKDAADAPLASAPTETASLPAPASYDQKTLVMLAGGAAALLTITSVMVGGLWRWSRGPKRLPPPLMHDIASVSLEGAAKGTSLSISPASPAPAVQAPPPLLPGSAGFGRPDDVPMPTTYAEALDVLGAAPDAALDAIKKIVDGMRQSWHPDLARTEFDRRVRLRRMQQINVAWDLVSQHRSAA
jgi:hypothetical protein